ncbi:Carbohydrate binding domain [Rhizoctonia solani]|uniref:Carbohydrate binding domain n=1 Tax=Rhizoctonia solani TaxID=456999 RepID=A0A8H7LYD3_9AGAM|nr:Carbohydrate binding domain [Rhizoctonia solani]
MLRLGHSIRLLRLGFEGIKGGLGERVSSSHPQHPLQHLLAISTNKMVHHDLIIDALNQAPTQPPQQSYNQPPPEQRPWDQHDQTKVEFGEEEKQKNWYDLDPERRKQLEASGLLAGAALLGGGFLAYKKHKENEEDKKALAWGLQNWMTDAQRRSQSFYQGGYSGKPTWVLTKGNRIPQGAFQAGQESDGTHYTSVALSSRGNSPNFQKGCIIGYGGDEIEVEDYEILIADPRSVHWAEASGTCNPQYLGAQPVEGGREQNGPLYIVQAPYKEGTHPGKTGPHLQGADITYGGKEKVQSL